MQGNSLSENPFDALFQKFVIMEDEGKINLTIVNDLDVAIQVNRENENFWISYPGDASTSFTLYHASRNMKLITEKIKKRVLNAAKNSDNPTIANNSIQILPLMSEILFSIMTMKENFQQKKVNYIDNQIRLLRENSFNLELLPTVNEEIKGLDKRTLKSHLYQLSEKIQEELFEI